MVMLIIGIILLIVSVYVVVVYYRVVDIPLMGLLLISTTFLIFVGVIAIKTNSSNQGYKQGQIDALTNIIKYEKTEHQNQTITWEKIEDKEFK